MVQNVFCRHCNEELKHTFVDLGMSPIANSFVDGEIASETHLPLRVFVCSGCFLVQLPVHEAPDRIFNDYAYFSSYSDSWVRHAKRFAGEIVKELRLCKDSFVVEIASNDGYLLQHFIREGIEVLGIEPAINVADAARAKGIPTDCAFFGTCYAKTLEGKKADLVVANNVLAHVPDINDFVRGISRILNETGIATLEFPSVYNLIRHNQFDTIYHEHYSYLSLGAAIKIFSSNGLNLYDAQELPTHGGSLRVYATTRCKPMSQNAQDILDMENKFGLNGLGAYEGFSQRVMTVKRKLLKTLIELKDSGKSIVGYGAAAKGNTLLNYCGIRSDFLDYVVDKSPHKQGKRLPGSLLPVHCPKKIALDKPDFVLILPWNLEGEIMEQLSYVREWGCKFIVPIPDARVVD